MTPDIKKQTQIAQAVAQKTMRLYRERQEAKDTSQAQADQVLKSDLAQLNGAKSK